MTRDLLLLRGFLLLCASSFEYVFHGVIPLVTRVLIYRPWCLPQRDLAFPGARKGSRIFDYELVKNRVRVSTRKAFGQMKVPVGVSEMCLVGEIGCIDDKCVSFPMASRVAQQLPNMIREMRPPVQRDNADVMNHLG